MPQSKKNNLSFLHAESSVHSSLSPEKINQLIIDSAPIGIALQDIQGKWIHVNQALCSMLGYTAEELLCTDFQSLTHPEEMDKDVQELDRLINGEMDKIVQEKRYLRKNGQYIQTQLYLSCIRDEDGNAQHLSLQIIDISEQVSAQAALMDVQAQLEGLVKNAPVLVTLKRIDGRYTLVNRIGTEYKGISADRMIGKTAYDFLDEQVAERIVARDKKIIESGEPISEEIESDDKVFLDTGFLIRNKAGEPAYIGNYSVDITERKLQEERLLHSETLSRLTIDLAQIGVTLADRDGRLLRVNKAFAEMLGYTEDELVNVDFQTITHKDDIEGDQIIFNNFINSEQEVVELEKRFLHKDGHAIWTHLDAACVRDANGDVEYLATQVQDISAKKKAETELMTAQAQMQAFFENIPAVLILKDMELNYTFVNSVGQKMTSLTPEEYLGKRAEDIFPADVAREVTRLDQQVLDTNEVVEYDASGFYDPEPTHGYEFVHKIIFPVRNKEGEVISVGSISIDVTESKKTERELQDTLQRLTYHVSNTPLAIVEFGRDLRIREWSTQAEKIFGWRKEEVLGHTSDEVGFIYEDDKQSLNTNIIEGLFSGKIRSAINHNRNITKDGRIVNIEWYNSALLNEYGELDSILTFALDRTAELSTQNALLESEQRFDMAASASKDGIFDHNLLTGDVWYSNNLWLLLGYEEAAQRLESNNLLRDLVHPEDAEQVADAYRKHFKSGHTLNYECRVRRADGHYLWTYTRADSVRDEQGKIIRIVGTVSDISERKATEQEIAHYLDELKRSNNDLEQFAYVASHDLQEPLRTIASFTELLGQRYRDQLDEHANEYIDFTIDGAKRMQGLIKDLLQYSRIGSKEKEFTDVDCNDVFTYVTEGLSLVIKESNTQVTSDDLPVVHGDDVQLSLLFQNLISNAIKYSNKDRQSKVHINARAETEYWLFCIKDNGIGISPDFFEKIFVIFQRLHARGEYEGSGIGLAICKKIVERHGGEIWLKSVPEEGSEFYFTIPVNSS